MKAIIIGLVLMVGVTGCKAIKGLISGDVDCTIETNASKVECQPKEGSK